jgi:hypothetical protein
MMILAFTLPPLGQGIELLLIAALSCWLLRISSGAGAAGWHYRLVFWRLACDHPV